MTFSADGCTGTMVFSGYKTLKPKDALDDYRQVGAITIGSCALPGSGDGGSDAGGGSGGGDPGGSADAGATQDDGASPDGSDVLGPGTSHGCACEIAERGGEQSLLWALLIVAVAIWRTRRQTQA